MSNLGDDLRYLSVSIDYHNKVIIVGRTIKGGIILENRYTREYDGKVYEEGTENLLYNSSMDLLAALAAVTPEPTT